MSKRPFSTTAGILRRKESFDIPDLAIPGINKTSTPRRRNGTRNSTLSHSKTKKTNQKTKFDYHCINSRMGTLRIPNKISSERIITKQKVIERVFEEEESQEEEDYKPVPIFATFSLLKTMDPDGVLSCISQIPIFLRTLDIEGSLDYSIVTSVSMNLDGDDVGTFVGKMSNEVNYYNKIHQCTTVKDIEETIVEILPVQKAYVWLKANNNNYIFNDTLKELLPVNKSIIGYSLLHDEEIVTDDPGDHKGFYIDKDLTLLRCVKSMVLLPIKNVSNDVVAVLQICGMSNPSTGEQISFSNYYVETLKIMRNIVQKKIFVKYRDNTIQNDMSKVFADIDLDSVSVAVKTISKFIEKQIPCEAAEFYWFDDRNKRMVCINDGVEYNNKTGGIAYHAGTTKELINVPHGADCKYFNKDIDGKYVNKSVIAKSFFMSRDHYVVVLRARWNSPIFFDDDVYFITSTAPLIFDLLHIASLSEERTKLVASLKKESELVHTAYEAMSEFVENGSNPWVTSLVACEKFFGTKIFFITTFDGRNMNFIPSNVKWPFDSCVAGTAYNYREITYAKQGDEIFPKELYNSLDVKARNSVAFPFRRNGRVAGAIEVINPRIETVDDYMMRLFGDLCSNIFDKVFLKNRNSV